jgi:hypothetical protein
MSELDQLLAYCRENQRVCPVPRRWHELWELLPEKRQLGIEWQPPLPLILAAWWGSKALLNVSLPISKFGCTSGDLNLKTLTSS